MLKLLKYELKKQSLSKLIILLILGILQVSFLVALVLDKQYYQGIIAAIAVFFSYGSLIYLAFESVGTFSKDLKTKTSYMLFLTPRTSYQIVGAKLISAAIQVIISGFAFLGIFLVNGVILLARYDELDELFNMIKTFISQLTGISIDIPFIISVLCSMITLWLLLIVTSFLSITLSTTLLSNNKFKGLLSGGLFVVLMIGVFKLLSVIGNMITSIEDSTGANFASAGYLAIVVIVFTIVTGWMLDKKVSV